MNKDKQSVDILDKFYLNNKTPLFRLWSALAFIRLGCKEKLPMFIKQFEVETDSQVKLITIRGIIELGGKMLPEYKKYIEEILKNGTWEEKVFAIDVIKLLGEQYYEQLLELLKDKQPDVRTASMLALAKVAPGKSIRPLYEAFNAEKEIDLKYNAWYCLSQCLDPKRAVISLRSFINKEKEITASLEKIMLEQEKAGKEKELKDKEDAKEEKLDIEMPRAGDAEPEKEKEGEIIINVDDKGVVTVRGEICVLDAEQGNSLSKTLSKLVRDKKRVYVVVRTEHKAPYDVVVNVMKACRKAGITKISLAKLTPESSKSN